MGTTRSIGKETHPGQFKHLSSEIFQHCSHVDSRLGADAHLVLCVLLEETFDTAARELEVESLVKAVKMNRDARSAGNKIMRVPVGCGPPASPRKTIVVRNEKREYEIDASRAPSFQRHAQTSTRR